jgi:AbiV family abortive infection protein
MGQMGPVTPQYLLEGAAYALEQTSFLLRDANILYRSGSYASAVVLAAFAREELGRSSILLDLRRRALVGGETFTTSQVQKACDDHVTKQRAGMLSLTLRTDRDTGLGKLLRARMENPPQSPEWKKVDAELKRIDATKTRRTPGDRHERRMAALYVEPLSDTQWNRPAEISALEAYEFLVDAVNDYAGRYQQGYVTDADMLRHTNPELHTALTQWSARPKLEPPRWPPYPGGEQAAQSAQAAQSWRTMVQRWGCSFIAYARRWGRSLIAYARKMSRVLMQPWQ